MKIKDPFSLIKFYVKLGEGCMSILIKIPKFDVYLKKRESNICNDQTFIKESLEVLSEYLSYQITPFPSHIHIHTHMYSNRATLKKFLQ